jgi:hypothetical protein
MALNLSLISDQIKRYGEKLYVEVANLGTLTPSEYTLMPDGRSIDLGHGLFASIRQSVLDEGFDADRVFTVGEFEAQRDAEGVRDDGTTWSVAKGKRTLMAY